MKVAFTVATANYLSQAKTLIDSFLAYNPEYKFYVTLLDKIDGRFDKSIFAPAEIIEVEHLNIEAFDKMLFSYNIFELSNALKPFVAEKLLHISDDVKHVLYFDCDIRIYAPFVEVEDLFSNHNILITPHFFTPVPLDGLLLDEASFLNSGIYNGGFFALKKCKSTFDFLAWWKDRMKEFCVVDFTAGLFVDQIWWNFVPLYFDGVHIIRNIGYNVAYWNLHERTLSSDGQKYLINDETPLSFFHFSGYDFNKPGIISKYQTRYDFESRKDLVHLFAQYQLEVMTNKHKIFRELSCYYVAYQENKKFDLKYIKHYIASRKNYPYRLKKKIKQLIR